MRCITTSLTERQRARFAPLLQIDQRRADQNWTTNAENGYRMEIIKYLVFVAVVHLSSFNSHADVTSVKRKKVSLKPHERHVANKRRRSTIFDTHGGNYSLPNISPVAVVSIKGSPQQEPEEAKITPVHHTMEKKKRRRRKKQKKRTSKKMKDEPKAHSRVLQYPKRKCRNWSDCKKDECCIRYSSTKGFCKRRPQKGERCKPILLPGLRDCPCDQGLTCTRYKTTKWGIKKHRCERLKHIEDEMEQRYV